MNTRVLALDLERTLIDDSLSGRPRPGLRAFLAFCGERFGRVAIFTSVEEAAAREVLSDLDRAGHLPPGLLGRLEFVAWTGEYKDLEFVTGVSPDQVRLVDDDGGWVRPDQRGHWVRVAPWDGGPDTELDRVRMLLEQWLAGSTPGPGPGDATGPDGGPGGLPSGAARPERGIDPIEGPSIRTKSRRLPVAVFVDVDGTLVGPYGEAGRQLRSSAPEVLAMLAEVAPVFLWSIVGPDNGTRLLREFPILRAHVAGSHAKSEALLERIERPFAIDDEALDIAVLRCRHFILSSSYFGGDDDDELRRLASEVVEEIRAGLT